VLAVEDLVVSFRTPDGEWQRVVDGVSFSVRRGETLCLVGESGCGKTMRAMALLGLLSDGGGAAGSVRLAGTELIGLSEKGFAPIRGSRSCPRNRWPTWIPASRSVRSSALRSGGIEAGRTDGCGPRFTNCSGRSASPAPRPSRAATRTSSPAAWPSASASPSRSPGTRTLIDGEGLQKAADVYLTRTGLDWLIVRPGTLLDTPGSGRVTAGPAVEYGDVHRDDVAAFIDAALHEPRLSRVIVELTSGTTPVADAVARLAVPEHLPHSRELRQ
jgi:energy-coupling factor transporter ATP-binding protein EcfA2